MWDAGFGSSILHTARVGRRLECTVASILLVSVIVAVLAGFITEGPARGSDTIIATFQQGVSPSSTYAGCTDAWLDPWSPTANYRQDNILYCGRMGSSGYRFSLLRFDITIIPIYAEIISATLSLQKPYWTAQPYCCALYEVLQPWDERVVSWEYRVYEPWQNPRWEEGGCAGVSERGPLVAEQVAPKAPGWVRWDISVLARRWVAQPERNHGLLLAAPEAEEKVRFTSAEGTPHNRPKLSIAYRLPEADVLPQVAIQSPRAWETVRGATTIQVQAADDHGLERVEFYVGEGQTFLGADAAPPFELAWDTTEWAWQTAGELGRGPAGLEALARIADLPYLRGGAWAHQVSSHDPHGRNSDMKNYLYKRGDEYVILDVEGPGCIYNLWFTSIHEFSRLRFYFDGETTPRVDLDVRAFFSGREAPFLAPLVGDERVSSGGFYSYLPMPFVRSCLVATVGEPWFYHILYHTYASGEGIQTFTGAEDTSTVRALWERAGEDPKESAGNRVISGTLSLATGETATLAEIVGAGSIASLKLWPTTPTEEMLNQTWLRIYWDEENLPSVDAPLGLFFGSGLGEAAVRGLLIGMEPGGSYYCYFPMPYWRAARLELNNGAPTAIALAYEVQYSQTPYPQGQAGYFHARYNERRMDADGDDYVILETEGTGQYVGTVLAMSGAEPGVTLFLEGDERVYVEHSYSPSLYGTGTEDYFLGGWYFRYGTFTLPLHGFPAERDDRALHSSCYRLHVGDLIPYSSALRFGIEHGGESDQPAYYRSLAFYYQLDLPAAHLTDALDLGDAASEAAHGYTDGVGVPLAQTSYHEGDWDTVPWPDTGRSLGGTSQFTLTVSPLNRGVQLWRRRDQSTPAQRALIYMDGELVGPWYSAYRNLAKRWGDEAFLIPGTLTAGKGAITVAVAMAGGAWDAYRYWAYACDSTVPITVRAYDTAGQAAEDMIRVRVELPLPATAIATPTASTTWSPTATATLSITRMPSPTTIPPATRTPSSTAPATPSGTATPNQTATPSATATPSPTTRGVYLPLVWKNF